LAVETGAGVVRLLDPASGQEFARLKNPYQEQAYRIFFSPDGALLVTVGSESYPLRVWDLRKIRDQLAEMDLDWDLPRTRRPRKLRRKNRCRSRRTWAA
jgi:glucose/arabinose dehydrogenase